MVEGEIWEESEEEREGVRFLMKKGEVWEGLGRQGGLGGSERGGLGGLSRKRKV